MIKRRVIKSVSRYVMVGLSASLATWLASKGVDPDDINQLTELLVSLAPAVATVIWSLSKNKSEAKEVTELKDEIETLNKQVKSLNALGLSNKDFNQ